MLVMSGLSQRHAPVPDKTPVQQHFHRGSVAVAVGGKRKTDRRDNEHVDKADGISSAQGD